MPYDLPKLIREAGLRGVVIFPAIAPTQAEEAAAAKSISRALSMWRQAIPEIVSAFDIAQRIEALTQSIRVDSPDDIDRVIKRVSDQYEQQRARFEQDERERARRSRDRHAREFSFTIKSASGVDVSRFPPSDDIDTAIQGIIRNNVSYVTAISDGQRRKIERIVWEAWQNKRSPAEVSRLLKSGVGLSSARAKLIARDQTAKLYGSMDEIRQRDAGIKQYVWLTVNDHRVRPKHAARHGKKYAWKKPPQGGHPGTEINCRCRARPYIKL